MTDDSTPLSDQEKAEEIARGSSKPWLDMIRDAEKAFSFYQDKCDGIDRLYADLQRQANPGRDREFAIFWANVEVLGPSIYARPPVPVVVPQFNDRKPVPRVASELLERSCVVAFRLEHIDHLMRLVRDDLNLSARGVAWIRDDEDSPFGFCLEHKDRKDFLHEPARNWREVGWVAGAAYLDRAAFKKRFKGVNVDEVEFLIDKDAKKLNATDETKKAKVWEIWSKDEKKIVWVTEGVEEVLDESDPYFNLEGFFPCPRPAFGTLQRRSLIPVPDMLFYKDQLEEINELTGRIGALAEALKVKGFYPAGAGEVGDAVEAALNSVDNRKVMVPISNWAAFGNGSKDLVVWLPIDMIATTIKELVELRKQIIADVYEITGLSDIMRGQTEASETLGAQQLKTQFGQVRIRDKTAELVRFARDIARLCAEVMAENVPVKTLLDLTQLDIPRDADVKRQIADLQKQIAEISGQIQQAHADPQTQQLAQQHPDEAKKALDAANGQIQSLQQQIQKAEQTATLEKVEKLIKEQRLRPFVLDIETDSTIQPDEQAEKQQRGEFLQALAVAIQQLSALVQELPQAAPFAGQVLKFAMAPFRAGRELEQAIDDFVQQVESQAGNRPPNPEAIAAQAKAETDAARLKIEARKQQFEEQKFAVEMQHGATDAQNSAADRELERWKAQLSALTSIEVARIGAKADSDSQAVSNQLEAALDFANQAHDQEMQREQQQHEANMATMQAANDAQAAQADRAHQAGMASAQMANDQQAAEADRAHQAQMATQQAGA